MLQRFTSRLPAIAMAGLLILGLSERAHADLAISLTGTSPAAALDSTGDISGNTSTGTAGVGLTSGQFSLSATGFGFLSPFAAPQLMDLSASTLSSKGAGTATVVFSQNFITAPVGMGTISESISGTASVGTVSVTYSTFGSNANTLFGLAPPGQNIPPAGQASVTFTATGAASATGAFTAGPGSYSLTETLVITFSGAGSVNLSSDSFANFTAVPEPSTMAIAGLGSLGLIAYGLRRRKALGA